MADSLPNSSNAHAATNLNWKAETRNAVLPNSVTDSEATMEPRTAIRPGSTFGRYRIEQELGRGGMGAVFLALDEQLDRKVAVKVPFFDKDDGNDVIDRFYREARSMAAVRHPNLCPVFDFGQIDGQHFLTMAFIEGQSLAERLKVAPRVPFKQAAALLKKVALALEKAHQAGIVHRDLKPGNIMIDLDEEPIIMDFGLARRKKSGEADLTHTGAVLGSPAYMAPEQVESRSKEIGPPTDVWALGAILYQLVCGRRPFEGSVASILGQIVVQEPVKPTSLFRDIPAEVDAVSQGAVEGGLATVLVRSRVGCGVGQRSGGRRPGFLARQCGLGCNADIRPITRRQRFRFVTRQHQIRFGRHEPTSTRGRIATGHGGHVQLRSLAVERS